jgi:hypothetical protein|tara:strand:+ start:808 stop:1065 length:258 start_codon:yes stop_codon:yes gene_type:complete
MNENYLDFWDLLVNEVAGSSTLFLALALIIIVYIAVKSRFPNSAVMAICILFLLIVSPFIPTLLAYVVLVITSFTGWQVARLIHR